MKTVKNTVLTVLGKIKNGLVRAANFLADHFVYLFA